MRRKRWFASLLIVLLPTTVCAVAEEVRTVPLRLCVDAASDLGPYRPVFVGIGYPAASEEIYALHNVTTLSLISEMNERLGGPLRWLRINGSLTGLVDGSSGASRYEIYEEALDATARYDWTGLDRTIDTVLQHHLSPALDLSYMPKALAAFPEYRNLWHGAVIGPPKDYRRWATMIEAMIRHLVARCGSRRVAQWPFEIWNEPDLCVVPYTKANRLDEMRRGYFWIPEMLEDASGFYRPSSQPRGRFKSDWEAYAELYDCTSEALRAGDRVDDLDLLVTECGPTTTPQPWLNGRYPAAWVAKCVDGILSLPAVQESSHSPKYFF